jgi:DNA-binding GntR family transcriptional regulator
VLTERQASVLAAIRDLTASLGFAPTLRELAGAQGVSHQRIRAVLAALEKLGLVAMEPATARSTRISGQWPVASEANARLRVLITDH